MKSEREKEWKIESNEYCEHTSMRVLFSLRWFMLENRGMHKKLNYSSTSQSKRASLHYSHTLLGRSGRPYPTATKCIHLSPKSSNDMRCNIWWHKVSYFVELMKDDVHCSTLSTVNNWTIKSLPEHFLTLESSRHSFNISHHNRSIAIFFLHIIFLFVGRWFYLSSCQRPSPITFWELHRVIRINTQWAQITNENTAGLRDVMIQAIVNVLRLHE